jgi:hypothetical protein
MIRVAFQMKLKPGFNCKEFAFAPAAPGTLRTRTGAGE